MKITGPDLRRIASLDVPAEALKEMLLFLAEQWERDEARLSKERDRKRRGSSAEVPRKRTGSSGEIPRKRRGNGAEVPVARVDDIIPTTSEVDRPVNNNPPVPPSKPDPDGFDAFWTVYPKRSGTTDRKGAVKAYRAAVKRADSDTIITAARAYSADMQARGKIGTEFVKQARTWLNGDLWTEHQPRKTADRPSGHYVQYGTESGDAWERHYRTNGKVPPRDSKGGWFFPSEFPESMRKAG